MLGNVGRRPLLKLAVHGNMPGMGDPQANSAVLACLQTLTMVISGSTLFYNDQVLSCKTGNSQESQEDRQ